MAVTLNSPNYASDWLKGESGSGEYHSRDTATLASGQGVVVSGTVLMLRTSDGAYVIADTTAPAAAILFGGNNAEFAIDTTAAAQPCVVVARQATVMYQGLTFGPALNTAALRAAAVAQLKTVGIVSRQGA